MIKYFLVTFRYNQEFVYCKLSFDYNFNNFNISGHCTVSRADNSLKCGKRNKELHRMLDLFCFLTLTLGEVRENITINGEWSV